MITYDILCVGNSLIDIFLTVENARQFLRSNEAEKEVCIKYGEKIHVDSSDFLVGGNASNVAVGVSRLGFTAGLCSETGDDEFAEKIEHTLLKEGVGRDLFQKTPGAASSFGIGLNFNGERTLFVKHVHRAHDFQFDGVSARWMYITSLGKKWKEAYKRAHEFAQKNNVTMVFSPGTHQLEEWGVEAEAILKDAHVLIGNKEEAQRVVKWCQKEVPDDVSTLLKELKSLGPQIVVITDGKKGSCALDEHNNEYSLGIYESEVVERTGAGDSYASGFVAAIMSGKTVHEAMKWGTLNAASVVGKVGAQAGLLTKDKLEKQLQEAMF